MVHMSELKFISSTSRLIELELVLRIDFLVSSQSITFGKCGTLRRTESGQFDGRVMYK